MEGSYFQISECNVSTESTVVVTGPQCFRYLRVNEGHNGFKICHEELKAKEASVKILSDHYTCHAWDQASKLVVCTEKGEIMVCDYDGFV